jgi:hypothetical protein
LKWTKFGISKYLPITWPVPRNFKVQFLDGRSKTFQEWSTLLPTGVETDEYCDLIDLIKMRGQLSEASEMVFVNQFR